MSSTDNPMKLTVWNDPSDPFDYTQLADNFTKIANHNHTANNGVKIPSGGIQDFAIGTSHIQNNAINSDKINNRSITGTDIALATIKGENIDNGQITQNHLTDDARAWVRSQVPTNTSNLISASTNPQDGQIVYYTPDDGTGTVWQLRYKGSSNTNFGTQKRWTYVGGTPYRNSSTADIIKTASTWDGSNVLGAVSVEVPFDGLYRVDYKVTAQYQDTSPSIYGFAAGVFLNGSVISDATAYAACPAKNEYATASSFSHVTVAQGGGNSFRTFNLGIVRTTGPTNLHVAYQSITITPIEIYIY